MLEQAHAPDLAEQVLQRRLVHACLVNDLDGDLELRERMLRKLDRPEMAPAPIVVCRGLAVGIDPCKQRVHGIVRIQNHEQAMATHLPIVLLMSYNPTNSWLLLNCCTFSPVSRVAFCTTVKNAEID
jgi:hypothetical protein